MSLQTPGKRLKANKSEVASARNGVLACHVWLRTNVGDLRVPTPVPCHALELFSSIGSPG